MTKTSPLQQLLDRHAHRVEKAAVEVDEDVAGVEPVVVQTLGQEAKHALAVELVGLLVPGDAEVPRQHEHQREQQPREQAIGPVEGSRARRHGQRSYSVSGARGRACVARATAVRHTRRVSVSRTTRRILLAEWLPAAALAVAAASGYAAASRLVDPGLAQPSAANVWFDSDLPYRLEVMVRPGGWENGGAHPLFPALGHLLLAGAQALTGQADPLRAAGLAGVGVGGLFAGISLRPLPPDGPRASRRDPLRRHRRPELGIPLLVPGSRELRPGRDRSGAGPARGRRLAARPSRRWPRPASRAGRAC